MAFNSKEECCFKGRGRGYLGDVNTCLQPGMGMNFGNPSGTTFSDIGDFVGNALDFTVNQTFENRPTVFRSGMYEVPECAPKIITGATVNLTLTCANFENMRRAVCGTVTSHAPKPIPQCKRYCPKDGEICEFDVIAFPRAGVDETSVVIKDQDGNELIPNEDYIADCFCIEFCKPRTFTKGQYLEICWTGKYGYESIDALNKEATFNSFTFKGKNSNNPTDLYLVKIHKISFDPIPDFSFLSENNVQIPLSGTIYPVNKYNLANTSKNKNNWYEIIRIQKGGCHV